MGATTRIGWADATFNMVIGCTKTSPGCTNCYAEALSDRFGFSQWGPKGTRRQQSAAYWKQPSQWNRRAQRTGQGLKVFAGSMCDVFDEHPETVGTLPRLWNVIQDTPHLTWLLLTKRPERIAAHLPQGWPWPHVWLGTSIETREYLWRADCLREIPAAHRFLSCEPLLADLGPMNLHGFQWAIIGGEWAPASAPWTSPGRAASATSVWTPGCMSS